MSFGNTIPLLNLTTNLVNGVTYTSSPQQLGEYVSLTAHIYSDQSLGCQIQFSNNGVDWDVTEAFNTVALNPTHQSIVVLGKWCRIRVTNTGTIPTTTLRFLVYGSPSNITTQSILVSSIAGKLSEVNIGNQNSSFSGNLDSSVFKPLQSYDFSSMLAGGFVAVQPTNTNLVLNASLGATTVSSQTASSSAILFPALAANDFVSLKDVYYSPSVAGVSYQCQFSARFTGTGDSDSFVGVGNSAPVNVSAGLNVSDGIGFGVYNNEAAIYIISNGSFIRAVQSAWNVDRMDSTQQANLVYDFNSQNAYQIKFVNGNAIFSICDTDGIYKVVHVHRSFTHTVIKKEFGFLSFIQGNAAVATQTTVRLWSWSLSSDFDANTLKPALQNTYTRTKLGIADNSNSYLFSLKNEGIIIGVAKKYGYLKPKAITVMSYPQVSASASTGRRYEYTVIKNSTLTAPTFNKITTNYLTSADTAASGFTTVDQISRIVSLENVPFRYELPNILLGAEESITLFVQTTAIGSLSDVNLYIEYEEYF
jgi:hypothetical protein